MNSHCITSDQKKKDFIRSLMANFVLYVMEHYDEMKPSGR